MTGLEEHLRGEARRLVARAASAAETDAAMDELHLTEHQPVRRGADRRSWLGVAAAMVLVIAGLAAVALVDREPATTLAPSTPTVAPIAPTTAGAPDIAPTTESPTAPDAPPAIPPPQTGTDSPTTEEEVDDAVRPLRPCTYTDPAWRAITVARALVCPDGTTVWVQGVVVDLGGGTRYLCDAPSATEAACTGRGLLLVGDGTHTDGELRGTKYGDQLRLTPDPPRPPGFVQP